MAVATALTNTQPSGTVGGVTVTSMVPGVDPVTAVMDVGGSPPPDPGLPMKLASVVSPLRTRTFSPTNLFIPVKGRPLAKAFQARIVSLGASFHISRR